jgi:CubicO group peptidase (beta-lactamase class C family)
MGATGQAFVTVDRVGTARAASGACVTIGDLARLGQLVLYGGVAQAGQHVIPADWIADMHQNGNRDAWNAGNFAHMFPDGRYRSRWYEVGDGRGSFAAVGIHEQWLWVDPVRSCWSNFRPGGNPATIPRRRWKSICSARSQKPCDHRRSRRRNPQSRRDVAPVAWL